MTEKKSCFTLISAFQRCTSVILKVTAIGVLSLSLVSKASANGTNLDRDELKNGSGPVVFLVNGFGGCNPCITRDLHQNLKDNGIAVYDFDWNDIHRKTNFGSDTQFLQQMEGVLADIPISRPIILIGHSFGGDSVLKVAQQTSRKIAMLGILDAVASGGKRTRVSVQKNVGYFYNRWTKNSTYLIPRDSDSSGNVNCQLPTQCDQKEQSYFYKADGSEYRKKCSFWDSCSGTYHRETTHGGSDAIYKDGLIQKQLLDLILVYKLSKAPISSALVPSSLKRHSRAFEVRMKEWSTLSKS